jgi:hypothetical protein
METYSLWDLEQYKLPGKTAFEHPGNWQDMVWIGGEKVGLFSQILVVSTKGLSAAL